MKEYNRKTKKYEETNKVGSLKKPETCKGGKPHDFVLLAPEYTYVDHLLNSEEIKTYYKIEDERHAFNELCDRKLSLLGVKNHTWRNRGTTKFYRCSLCGKKKYEHKN